MKRVFGLAVLGIALGLPSAWSAADGELNGNWKLTTLAPMGSTESTAWLFKLETKEGQTSATLITDGAPKAKTAPELVSFKVTGDHVRVVVKNAVEQVFQGRLSKDGKKIIGVFGNDQTTNAAYMAPTEMTALGKTQTAKVTATAAELKSWADAAVAVAKEHNPKSMAEVHVQFALALLAKKSADLAVEQAFAAEKSLDNKSSQDLQIKVLQTLTRALQDAGKAAQAVPVATRLENLETVLDNEYKATVPPFKGQKFEGRKGQSDRAVVMELFTGAQCPPCVAADVAFDVLQKSYKPSELVLIQYHMHIPGPDPMTNTDTEARWKFYRDAYGQKGVPGTPTTLFNGTPKAGGGGAMAAAEKRYEAYRAVIDPLLEETTTCKIRASARRVGDKVQIQTSVAGMEKPGKDAKLRLVLVEETIRFVGSNKLRFHHQVVRAMPGGADGVAVMNPTLSVENEVDLRDLRAKLTTYLDNYPNTEGARGPFPQVSRPLDFHGLRVIAFLQDDSTKEILQAVQVDVVQ